MALTSVLMTRSSVIYTRRVRFHMQGVISTRSVIFTRTNVTTALTIVISTLTRVIFTRRV
jgi:hypothetical protein